jgi:Dolichyl-phosphate-mannose-protein mannosyltransferase
LEKVFAGIYMTDRNSIYYKSLIGWFIILVILVTPLCLRIRFDHDEFEHIHSAWYIANGYLPYLDFFQNHNPLLWYLFAPIIKAFGDTMTSIFAIRLLTFAFMAGTLGLTFEISRKLTGSRQTSLLATLLLLSSGFFVISSLEIRPDVPQMFFGLLSIYYLICFGREQSKRGIICCGMSLSISFLFLQKAVFLIAVLGLVLLYQFLTGKIRFQYLPWFAAAFLLPLGLFSLYLYANGLIEDYVVTNWLVNMNRLKEFSPMRIIGRHLNQNLLFFICSCFSIPYLLSKKKVNGQIKQIALISLLLIFSVFLVGRPHKQNFLQFIPLFSITSAVMMHSLFDWFALQWKARIILITIFLGVSSLSVASLYRSSSEIQLKRIQYVLDNSEPEDKIYDGNIMFNLFRPDVHYFWYSVRKGKLLDSYNLVTDNKYGDYDVYDLILTTKPRFISKYAMNRKDPRFAYLSDLYSEISFKTAYMRKPDQNNTGQTPD